MFSLYLVTDRRRVPDLPTALADVLDGTVPGTVGVQLREKDLSEADLLALGHVVAAVCRRHGAPLFVNGSATVARAVGAAGIHCPERWMGDTTGLLVGASTHDAAGVRAAGSGGSKADFLVLGPVFPTPGKGPPMGLATFSALVRQATRPVFALGGVTVENAAACVEAGASGVAVIGAAWDQPDRRTALREILSMLT